ADSMKTNRSVFVTVTNHSNHSKDPTSASPSPRPSPLAGTIQLERALPPHPGPLPQGEGERFGSARASHRLVTDRQLLELRCTPTNSGRTQARPIVQLNRYGQGRGPG